MTDPTSPLHKRLLELAKQVAAQEQVALATLGRKYASDSRFFVRLEAGGTCSLRKYEDLIALFSAHLGADTGADIPDARAANASDADAA